MRHRFLLAAVLTPFALNGPQSVAYTTVNAPARAHYTRHATDSLEDQAATRVAAAVCSKRIAVLGELPEHGEGRGFNIKARVIQQLVEHCGFHSRI
jgi:erythromycin esterase-like protein